MYYFHDQSIIFLFYFILYLRILQETQMYNEKNSSVCTNLNIRVRHLGRTLRHIGSTDSSRLFKAFSKDPDSQLATRKIAAKITLV